MEQPAMYNLVSAAAAAGVNRSTVLRAIKAGRLSGQRDATGSWEIDPAEFHRVFPPLPAPAPAVPQQAQQELDGQIALLRNMLDNMQTQVADLRIDRDHWRDAFLNAQRQLTPPAQPDAREGNGGGNVWQRFLRWRIGA